MSGTPLWATLLSGLKHYTFEQIRQLLRIRADTVLLLAQLPLSDLSDDKLSSESSDTKVMYNNKNEEKKKKTKPKKRSNKTDGAWWVKYIVTHLAQYNASKIMKILISGELDGLEDNSFTARHFRKALDECKPPDSFMLGIEVLGEKQTNSPNDDFVEDRCFIQISREPSGQPYLKLHE